MGLFNWLFRRRAKPLPYGDDAARGVRPDHHPPPAPARKPPPHGDDAARSVLAAASVGYITSAYARLATSESVRAMTRDAWFASSDTLAMLCFLHGRGSGRKFRLFATACARDLLAQTPDQDEEAHHPVFGWAAAISEAEAFADGGDPPRNRGGWQVACRVCDVINDEDVAHSALGFDADVGLWTTPIEETVPRMTAQYRTHPAVYLRDIFGAVFHEGASDPEHRPATVLSL